MADPDLELGGGGGEFVFLLALPEFLPSVMSCFLRKIRGGLGECPPLDSPLLSKNVRAGRFINSAQRIAIVFKGKSVEI